VKKTFRGMRGSVFIIEDLGFGTWGLGFWFQGEGLR